MRRALLVLFLVSLLVPHPLARLATITPVSALDIVQIKISADKYEVAPGEVVTLTVSVTPTVSVNDTSLVIYVNGAEYTSVYLGNLVANSTVSYQFTYTPSSAGYYLIAAELRQEVYS